MQFPLGQWGQKLPRRVASSAPLTRWLLLAVSTTPPNSSPERPAPRFTTIPSRGKRERRIIMTLGTSSTPEPKLVKTDCRRDRRFSCLHRCSRMGWSAGPSDAGHPRSDHDVGLADKCRLDHVLARGVRPLEGMPEILSKAADDLRIKFPASTSPPGWCRGIPRRSWWKRPKEPIFWWLAVGATASSSAC